LVRTREALADMRVKGDKLEALREKARAVGKAARNDTREERASAPLREAIAVMLAEVDKP
jgi:hypothetical protein